VYCPRGINTTFTCQTLQKHIHNNKQSTVQVRCVCEDEAPVNLGFLECICIHTEPTMDVRSRDTERFHSATTGGIDPEILPYCSMSGCTFQGYRTFSQCSLDNPIYVSAVSFVHRCFQSAASIDPFTSSVGCTFHGCRTFSQCSLDGPIYVERISVGLDGENIRLCQVVQLTNPKRSIRCLVVKSSFIVIRCYNVSPVSVVHDCFVDWRL
jgi:hypothetical protein